MADINFDRGAYDATTASTASPDNRYLIGNVVQHQGFNWRCLTDNTVEEPSDSATDWVGYGYVSSAGGSTPPTPTEHFTFSLSPSSTLETGVGTTLVTATMGVTGPGFNYSGYTNARVIGPSGDLSVSAVSGTGTTFTASVSTIVAGSYRFTADIRSTGSGVILPNHTVSATFTVAPAWRRLQADAQPAAFPQLGDEAPWTGSDTLTLTKTTNNSNIYFALPTRDAGYTFKSGVLFLSQVLLGTIGSDHTLYTIPDFNGAAMGTTLTIDITET